MSKYWLSILFVCLFTIADAQEYGSQWVLGYNESVLDFRNDSLVNYAIGPVMPMVVTNANICDSNGNLLYYTNGVYIAGENGEQISNGDSLSPCAYTNEWACCGLGITQAALFLPRPNDTTKYYLFHFSNDTLDGGRPGTLYYSLIDKTLEGGKGAVIQKNVAFFIGHVLREGGMTACKHANGSDWWIVVGDHYTNTYYEFLLTFDTILGPFTQSIGPSYYGPFDLAYSKFSEDGSKYVTGAEGPILVMDFDRCTGVFSNPITFYNPEDGIASVEFSPNGRFVYATNAINLTQFDLSSGDPQNDSSDIFDADSNDVARMDILQLAPNGKIYGSCYNGGFYYLHVVNYPDSQGNSCNYVDTGLITLTISTANLPNMINYQLGPLCGSPCDTIYPACTSNIANTIAENLLRIMPNPANKYLYVEMGMQGDYEFRLYNSLGQLVAVRETRQVDDFDTEGLASGVYFLRVMNRNNSSEVATKKVVVAH